MDYDKLIGRWSSRPPGTESADRVEALLIHYFGGAALNRGAGSSHQYQIKDARLAGVPGFGIGGHLVIPVSGGQRVKKVYLRRIALAVKRTKQAEVER